MKTVSEKENEPRKIYIVNILSLKPIQRHIMRKQWTVFNFDSERFLDFIKIKVKYKNTHLLKNGQKCSLQRF